MNGDSGFRIVWNHSYILPLLDEWKLSPGPLMGDTSPILTAILWDVDDEIFDIPI